MSTTENKSFHAQVALNELVELADAAEEAMRAAETTGGWLVADTDERRHVGAAQAAFRKALEEINAARASIEGDRS